MAQGRMAQESVSQASAAPANVPPAGVAPADVALAGVPWGWVCECGVTSDHTAQFCWDCGKPASGGMPVPLAPATALDPELTLLEPGFPHSATVQRGGVLSGEETLEDEEPAPERSVAADSGPVPAEVVAPLRVVGRDGKLLVSIEESPSGPLLKLFTPSGQPAVCLGVTPDGSALTLAGKEGAPQVLLLTGPHAGHLCVTHADGQTAAELRSAPEGGQCNAYPRASLPARG